VENINSCLVLGPVISDTKSQKSLKATEVQNKSGIIKDFNCIYSFFVQTNLTPKDVSKVFIVLSKYHLKVILKEKVNFL